MRTFARRGGIFRTREHERGGFRAVGVAKALHFTTVECPVDTDPDLDKVASVLTSIRTDMLDAE